MWKEQQQQHSPKLSLSLDPRNPLQPAWATMLPIRGPELLVDEQDEPQCSGRKSTQQ